MAHQNGATYASALGDKRHFSATKLEPKEENSIRYYADPPRSDTKRPYLRGKQILENFKKIRVFQTILHSIALLQANGTESFLVIMKTKNSCDRLIEIVPEITINDVLFRAEEARTDVFGDKPPPTKIMIYDAPVTVPDEDILSILEPFGELPGKMTWEVYAPPYKHIQTGNRFLYMRNIIYTDGLPPIMKIGEHRVKFHHSGQERDPTKRTETLVRQPEEPEPAPAPESENGTPEMETDDRGKNEVDPAEGGNHEFVPAGIPSTTDADTRSEYEWDVTNPADPLLNISKSSYEPLTPTRNCGEARATSAAQQISTPQRLLTQLTLSSHFSVLSGLDDEDDDLSSTDDPNTRRTRPKMNRPLLKVKRGGKKVSAYNKKDKKELRSSEKDDRPAKNDKLGGTPQAETPQQVTKDDQRRWLSPVELAAKVVNAVMSAGSAAVSTEAAENKSEHEQTRDGENKDKELKRKLPSTPEMEAPKRVDNKTTPEQLAEHEKNRRSKVFDGYTSC